MMPAHTDVVAWENLDRAIEPLPRNEHALHVRRAQGHAKPIPGKGSDAHRVDHDGAARPEQRMFADRKVDDKRPPG